MKTLNRFFISSFILSVLLFYNINCFAQSAKQLNKLKEFKIEKHNEFKKLHEDAILKAELMGLPLKIKLGNGQVAELMYFENDMPVYFKTDNATGAATISADDLYPGGIAGFSLDGSGITLGMWDGGRVKTSHAEFGGRVIIGDNAAFNYNSDHSTHVAGTMVATGLVIQAKGMSYRANLVARNWEDDVSEMTGAGAGGLYVSNHSYGIATGWTITYMDQYVTVYQWFGDPKFGSEDYKFGFYDQQAHDWDVVANNAPYYLIVKSAGNDRGMEPFGGSDKFEKNGGEDGFDCTAHSAVSKNVLTVGAVNGIPGGYSAPADVIMTSFSNWGPCDDGRIKPDLVADGVNLYSTSYDSINDTYDYKTGTSMSGPCIAGSVGLLCQHEQNLYGNIVYRSSTMKGLLIHTADEAGPNPGPDYMFGWGLANIKKAAELMQNDRDDCVNIRELVLSQNQVIKIPVLKDPNKSLKVTICWNDPASSPLEPALNPSTKMLVNDIDLRVVSGNNTYFPWILDKNNPANAATTGDNSVDNIEQVEINNASSELFTITITHKRNLLEGEQIVSLIYSGNLRNIQDVVDLKQNTISSGNVAFGARVSLSAESTVIGPSAYVGFASGNSIKLKLGFNAKANSHFLAQLDPSLNCSPGTFKSSSYKSPLSIPDKFIFERNIDPDQDELIDYQNENQEISLKGKNNMIYPNPVNKILYFEGLTDTEVDIYDMSGRKILSKSKANGSIDVSGLNQGIYTIQLRSNGKAYIQKFIKQ